MKKLALILIAVTMLSLTLASSVRANGVEAYVNFDKVEYRPGEQGTISITIRNNSGDPIEVKNVSVVFSNWMMYTVDGWDELGNKTIDYSDLDPIGSNKTVALDAVSFTVPSDGRAVSTHVDILVYTNKPVPIQYDAYVTVVDPSTLGLLRAMDNIVTLLTIVAILAIISAIVIAAAVFLSGRRPSVTWQKEE